MMDPCAHCEEMMQPYLDHVLTDAEMHEAEAHLAECEGCRRRYRFEESLRVYVRKAADEQMPAELREKLAALRIPLDWKSTSPGGVRSSQGTSRAGSDRAPSSGTLVPGRAREQDGVEADSSVGRGDGVDRRSRASRRRRGRPRVGRGRGRRRGRRARLPRPAATRQARSGATRPGRAPSRGTGRSRPVAACAPLTTTISSTGALLQRREHAWQKLDLLRRRRAVARRRAGRKHDGGDHARAASARRTSARASGSFHSVRGSGVAASRSSTLSIRHGIGATPASAIRVEPSSCRATATPTCGNAQRLRSIALR